MASPMCSTGTAAIPLVIVVLGADHFFHGKLNIIRDIVLRAGAL